MENNTRSWVKPYFPTWWCHIHFPKIKISLLGYRKVWAIVKFGLYQNLDNCEGNVPFGAFEIIVCILRLFLLSFYLIFVIFNAISMDSYFNKHILTLCFMSVKIFIIVIMKLNLQYQLIQFLKKYTFCLILFLLNLFWNNSILWVFSFSFF